VEVAFEGGDLGIGRRRPIERRVQLELPGFLGLAAIVASTDLIATVPRTIGEALTDFHGVLTGVPRYVGGDQGLLNAD
jgi:hypothetical protein